jgi:hypothetical protein
MYTPREDSGPEERLDASLLASMPLHHIPFASAPEPLEPDPFEFHARARSAEADAAYAPPTDAGHLPSVDGLFVAPLASQHIPFAYAPPPPLLNSEPFELYAPAHTAEAYVAYARPVEAYAAYTHAGGQLPSAGNLFGAPLTAQQRLLLASGQLLPPASDTIAPLPLATIEAQPLVVLGTPIRSPSRRGRSSAAQLERRAESRARRVEKERRLQLEVGALAEKINRQCEGQHREGSSG